MRYGMVLGYMDECSHANFHHAPHTKGLLRTMTPLLQSAEQVLNLWNSGGLSANNTVQACEAFRALSSAISDESIRAINAAQAKGITIRIAAIDGAESELTVKAIRYVKFCPYDGHRFETQEQDRIHCSESHRVMYYKKVTKKDESELSHYPI